MKELYESSLLALAENQVDIVWHPNSEKVAVIMDPRYDKLMVGVIKNFMQHLNPCGWNLVIITHEKYAVEFSDCLVIGISEKRIYYKDGEPNISVDTYNGILMSKEFWEFIPGEHILIFQKDCYMYKMFDEKFLEYDFVGARSVLFVAENNYQQIVTNGGFSLRKKTAMLESLKRFSFTQLYKELYKAISTQKMNIINPHNLGKKNEDVFFSLACKNTIEHHIQPEFAVEAEYNIDAAGHHGWNKSYHTEEQVLELLSANPNYKDLLENLSA